ncbi:prepilin-type N-terminal cleavage/methylation domain-containing protein [Geothermobacter ehrlichii]|uniref:prepilin-type N-terminal cleavage/methylation domain-containing protein n=1 Tax=Geothermobacter ehrlichii TaxID=213224 RepID=UPI001652CCC4|nr:prepilin-type N-terminal cleavage/methylation domain-containing protein [Geothermobacter ehrlichii]
MKWTRPESSQAGFSLIEVMIALCIMGILAAFMFPAFWEFQKQGLREICKNDLYDRAERLKIFVGDEIKMAGFLVGRNFSTDLSIGGNTYPTSIVVTDNDNADDEISFIKGEESFPPIFVLDTLAGPPVQVRTCVAQDSLAGLSSNDKRARLGLEGGTVHDRIAFANQKRIYQIFDDVNDGVSFGAVVTAGNAPCNKTFDTQLVTISLTTSLIDDVPEGTEIFPVRVRRFHIVKSGSESQLRYSDLDQDEIIDRQVDGLQLQYLVDGNWVDAPGATEDIRAVRFYLLVRALAPDQGLINTVDYSSQMGNAVSNTYGPYNDAFRRIVVVGEVEVKNYVTR